MPRSVLPGMLILVAGCAAGARAPSSAPVASPDCSFRSATSCWRLEPRLPFRGAEPADSGPATLPKPAVIASGSER